MKENQIDNMKAVFLDRDGVLCEDTDYITTFNKLKIFSYARQAVEEIQKKGYLTIVVTNQSAVARGMMTEEMVRNINDYLKVCTGVDEIYYCPHLPPDNENVNKYRIFCDCRKPGNGLIMKAAKKFRINLSESYMVGDRETDIEAGIKSNLRTVLLSKNIVKTKANEICSDLLFFAKKL